MTPIARSDTRSRTDRHALRRLPISRRLALVGAVAVLGLTACGSSDEASPAGSTLPAPAVIEVAGAGGGGGGGGLAPAASEMAGDAAVDKMMLPMSLVYEWAGQTVDLTSPAASWSFPTGGVPTTEQVEALAAAFGVSGEPVELGSDLGGGWSVGPNDGSAPSVTVAADAMQSWWYSPAWQTTTVVEPCAFFPPGDPAADPTTADLPVCEEPEPPAGVPSEAEAEEATRALFATLGIDASQYEFETWADEWGASTTAFLVLDGVRTNVTVNVGFGEEGAITWAGGFLATPQRNADYPRIGVEAAVQRLNDQMASWMIGVGPMARGGVAMSAGVGAAVTPEPMTPATAVAESGAMGSDSAAPGEATSGSAVPGEVTTDDGAQTDVSEGQPPTTEVLIDPLDCTDPAVSCPGVDPMVPAEPVVVRLVEVEPTLEQVWAADGTVWLLPGYLFREATGADGMEGMTVSVLAVEDQYLVQAEPAPMPEPLPEPMPVETAVPLPAETVPAETVPAETVPGAETPVPADLGVVGLSVG